jgi:hypothetical protein
MSRAARLLVEALRRPESVAGLDADGWTALLSAARAEQLIASLAHRLEGQIVPEAAAAILADAKRAAEQGAVHALWEAEMARRALAPLHVPIILLKGTAFVAAGLDASKGRFVGDLDILVERERLPDVERALLAAGWEWVKESAYDSHYYRSWMHELPPLIHRDRDRMIDVHHTILPPTARPKPDAAALIADSIPLPDGMRILSSPDLIVHAAAHLFADGDLAGGLRNLWDIDRLLREFTLRRNFIPTLLGRARHHDLEREVRRALRLSKKLYGTPLLQIGPLSAVDRLYRGRLLARDGWARPTRWFTRQAFYVRSHWIRMPPLLLARHLFIKALFRRRAEPKAIDAADSALRMPSPPSPPRH